MLKTSQYSSYDSQEQDDQVDPGYLSGVISIPKSTPNLPLPSKTHPSQQQADSDSDPQYDDDDAMLKPKLKCKKQQINILNNPSTLTVKSKVPRRPLTAAYTFKLPTPQIKRKRHDPVSLFQQTSQAWKKDKFLTSRGNNREGRKLELDKRNRNIKVMQVQGNPSGIILND